MIRLIPAVLKSGSGVLAAPEKQPSRTEPRQLGFAQCHTSQQQQSTTQEQQRAGLPAARDESSGIVKDGGVVRAGG
jgi:hypothetical protein